MRGRRGHGERSGRMIPGGVVRSGERYNFSLTVHPFSTNLSLPTFLNHSHTQPQLVTVMV